jgi:ubiquitin-activating enzyme E1
MRSSIVNLKARPHAGGLVTQVKESKQGKHAPLAKCLTQPGNFLVSDFSKLERPQLLHVAFQALEKFRGKEGRCPRPGNAADADAFKSLCEQVNGGLVRCTLFCVADQACLRSSCMHR